MANVTNVLLFSIPFSEIWKGVFDLNSAQLFHEKAVYLFAKN